MEKRYIHSSSHNYTRTLIIAFRIGVIVCSAMSESPKGANDASTFQRKMLKLMELCNTKGFVYGNIPEDGNIVYGDSDNLRSWWEEKVKFNSNGPLAIAKYEEDNSGNLPDGYQFLASARPMLHDLNDLVKRTNQVQVQEGSSDQNVNLYEAEGDLKRKQEASGISSISERRLHTRKHSKCPFNDYRLGLLNVNARNNHQLNCPHRFHDDAQMNPVTLDQPTPERTSKIQIQSEPDRKTISSGRN